MREKLLVSISGGYTSGVMSIKLWQQYQDRYDMVFVFANTGQENEETLQFVNNIQNKWGIPVVWVEAVVDPKMNVGTISKVVTFETAHRDAGLFKDVCSKYGISNTKWPHCTRELKQRPIHDYVRSVLGWKQNEYETAIGIRTDENRRATNNEYRPVYPLIDWMPMDKIDVNDWWEDQPFSLGLIEHQGNCKWCWKKSFKKHYLLISEKRNNYDVPLMLEERYGRHGTEYIKFPDRANRVFFRGNKSTKILLQEADIANENPMSQVAFDLSEQDAGCSESCEFIPMV